MPCLLMWPLFSKDTKPMLQLRRKESSRSGTPSMIMAPFGAWREHRVHSIGHQPSGSHSSNEPGEWRDGQGQVEEIHPDYLHAQHKIDPTPWSFKLLTYRKVDLKCPTNGVNIYCCIWLCGLQWQNGILKINQRLLQCQVENHLLRRCWPCRH